MGEGHRLEESDFEALFRAHYAALCSFAHGYVQSRDDAEEVVQSVFLSVWSQRAGLVIQSSVRAYLFASVRNLALNRSARARLEQRYYTEAGDNVAESVPDRGPSLDEQLQASEVRGRVEEAIAELPPGCRRVLRLRWEQELSYAEIAEALGISVKGVENQLGRARAALRLRLSNLID